jgi:serine/threonine protein kinase
VGDPPFTGEVQSILYRIVPEIAQPPRSLGADIREELQDIVLRCLEKDPAKRPQKAGQVADALRRHRASLATDEFRMSSMRAMTQAGCWYESMSSPTRSGGPGFGVDGIALYGNDLTLVPGRA